MEMNDLNKLMEKYQPAIQKTGEQLAKAVKSAEKDLSKMYKVAQTHVEIQMKKLQKEKLYYDLGKYVAEKLVKDSLDVPSLEQYKKRLTKIDSEGDKIQKKLSRITKSGKKKASK